MSQFLEMEAGPDGILVFREQDKIANELMSFRTVDGVLTILQVLK